MKELLVHLLDKPMGIVVYQLLHATQFTVYLSLIAFVGGGLIAMPVTFLRVLPNRYAVAGASAYIWIFQSVPLLMLLFLLGLGAPRLLGLEVDPWIAASIALTLFTSAYVAEVWRGAIHAVPEGQWEGAQALGLGYFACLRLVVVPQALRAALGPTVGFMVQIVKGTSLAYIIGFQDLMNIGKRWANAPVDGTEPFVIFPLMALIYFCLCYPLSWLALTLDHRMARRHEPQSTSQSTHRSYHVQAT